MLRAETESTRSVSSSACTSMVAPEEPWVRMTFTPDASKALRRSCTKSVCSSLVSMNVYANASGNGCRPCRWKPQATRPRTNNPANTRFMRRCSYDQVGQFSGHVDSLADGFAFDELLHVRVGQSSLHGDFLRG